MKKKAWIQLMDLLMEEVVHHFTTRGSTKALTIATKTITTNRLLSWGILKTICLKSISKQMVVLWMSSQNSSSFLIICVTQLYLIMKIVSCIDLTVGILLLLLENWVVKLHAQGLNQLELSRSKVQQEC
jgi:hypothetical protein